VFLIVSLGQAAIQMCQLVGAEIFVTVGSDEKRKFIEKEYNIPTDHIMNSRTLEFVDQIRAKTCGKGSVSFIMMGLITVIFCRCGCYPQLSCW
jgi:NADPH-dependent curcumin reductase CurA